MLNALLNELASVSRRKVGMSWKETGDALAAIPEPCSPLPLTIDTRDAGLRIAAKYGFPFYDALIAAAALEAGCTTLYSEDFQDGQVLEGRLTVRNPFRHSRGSPSHAKRWSPRPTTFDATRHPEHRAARPSPGQE